ncbi:MAG: chromosomal replication initiator protein DnaA [Negativicoccus succinicivorans]|uniref:chromosomal replication initiator protein DnaA n=1 Tax=Negativicoccus succinicivorans TaxID=620903 RepID=UPI0026EFBC66|nr:chromosomal replication initiator protein DnaA [Negativicoccus succinicivorans]MBS6027806.1 chromosomal replication initiator protein DnaA [Negativicoccus succinicivorans]
MTDIFDFWETVLARLGERISPEMLNWLMSHVLPLTLTEDTLTAQVSKPFLKIWLEKNLLSDLQATVNEVAARPLTLQITLPQATDVPIPPLPSTNTTETFTLPEPPVPVLPKPTQTVVQETSPSTPPAAAVQIPAAPESEYNFGKHSIPIDPACTFDNFIVSNSNTLARSAAFAVAQQPAQYQNPLFIYGPSGLGKTHLMHAICNYVRTHTPEKKFLFLTSEDFTNDFISALTQKGVEHNRAFREKYRSVDYLLIDDVQFFGKKDGTQLEFFHTFNELLNSKKQIVMTCDRLPENMEKVEQRLISRFRMGLVVEIQPPDFEIRSAYLQKKAAAADISIPTEVVSFLAENFTEDFRELGGVFNRIATLQSLSPEPITVEWAQQQLADILPAERRIILNPDIIINEVASFYKIRRDKLVGKTRPKNIVFPRQIAMFLCRDMLDLSFKEIAAAFNKNDHTTVMHAYDKIYKELQTNIKLQEEIKQIRQFLTGG